jgi:N-acetylmuramoyl-L-alanine amidase
MKRYLLLLAICLILAVCMPGMAQTTTPQKKTWVIVIDPGHGGHDPGAVYGNVKEKDITLAIALKLGKQLSAIENTKVYYTRDKDETLELYKRPQKANERKADLFISIHCNAVESPKPYGTETWVMGLHRSKANLEVARAENAVILLEEDYKTKYDGFDPNSPEADIIFSLYQNAHLDQSVEVASLVQKELRTTAQRFDRGVKQAGFLVLWRINMPGILVEAGFISNENERKYLASDAGQNSVATSVYNAIVAYREKIDGAKVVIKTVPDTKPETPQTISTNTTATSDAPKESKPPADVKQPDSAKINAGANPAHPSETKKQEPPKQTISTLYYSVQFLNTVRRRELNDPSFASLKEVQEYFQDGSYRYISGQYKTAEEAIQHKNEMQKMGFPDAFVVAFYNGKRISLTDAAKLQGNNHE